MFSIKLDVLRSDEKAGTLSIIAQDYNGLSRRLEEAHEPDGFGCTNRFAIAAAAIEIADNAAFILSEYIEGLSYEQCRKLCPWESITSERIGATADGFVKFIVDSLHAKKEGENLYSSPFDDENLASAH